MADPGEGRGARPPYLLDQTEARRVAKIFLETGPPLLSGASISAEKLNSFRLDFVSVSDERGSVINDYL